MSNNITLRLDEKTLDRLRHIAVGRRMSVSAWVGALVTRAVNELDGFELARKQALQALANPVRVAGVGMLGRNASHER